MDNVKDIPNNKFTLLDMHPHIDENVSEKDIPEDVGVFKEDGLTEDFPFEIKAIFWVMVLIVTFGLFGAF